MKAVIVFAALLSVALSGPASGRGAPEDDDGMNMKYFLVEREDGLYEIEDLVNAEVDLRSSESDLTYHFFSRSNPSSSVQIKSNTISSLRNTNFDVNKDTVFVIHGWQNNVGSAVNVNVRGALLPKFDVNLFVVDWSPIAAGNYLSAMGSVVTVGNYIGAFIRSLVSTYGLRLDRVSFVGHSLGAHVAGNAGAFLNGQIGQIVGLDPAGPLFSTSNTNNRLDPTDGRFVQVIHTNGGLLGMSAAIGHSDYYPNGGSSQPGCGIDLTGSCAHARAYFFYAESAAANSNGFVARQCDSYNNFSNGRCSSSSRSVMGGFGVDTSARGDYYLDTNRASPYAQG